MARLAHMQGNSKAPQLRHAAPAAAAARAQGDGSRLGNPEDGVRGSDGQERGSVPEKKNVQFTPDTEGKERVARPGR